MDKVWLSWASLNTLWLSHAPRQGQVESLLLGCICGRCVHQEVGRELVESISLIKVAKLDNCSEDPIALGLGKHRGYFYAINT